MAYTKTEWVENETIVSADCLNKIEDELESLSLNSATKSELASLATKNEVDSLKQSVSDGKTLVANAITGKGVSTLATASFSTMASNIRKIASGRKYASGTSSVIMFNNGMGTMPSIEVTNLDFRPSVVVANDLNSPGKYLVYCFGSSFYTDGMTANFGMGMVGDGTFRLNAFSRDNTSTKYEWVAYE